MVSIALITSCGIRGGPTEAVIEAAMGTPHEPVAVNAGVKHLKLRGAARAVHLNNALVQEYNIPDLPKEVSKVTPVWIRTVFLLPFLWAAVDPLRFIEVHPTPFAKARSAAAYRDTSYFVSLIFGLMTIFATVLTHIFEAGRRHQLEGTKVSPKERYTLKPSNLPSEQLATSGMHECGTDAPNLPTSSLGARCSESFTWRPDTKDIRVWTSFDVLEALVHGALLAVAMYSDVLVRYPNIAGVFTLGYALIPIVGGLIMKRIMYGVAEAQGRHLSGWVTNTAVLVCKTAAFNLLLLLIYVVSSAAYPYDLDTSALNQWLQEGNHSSLRCDNEAVFWATFVLPVTVRVGVDRTIECDEPLCGYRDWTALCQAVRNVGVHFTSSYATMVTVICSLLLVIIFFVLGGSDRISHKKDGSLNLQPLLEGHILVILACSGVMVIMTLLNVARLMVTTPLLLFAATPGFEAEPLAMLGEAKWNNIVYIVALPGPLIFGAIAIALLPYDTLSKFMKGRRKRSYFLSYKQNEYNDGAVQMLADQLRKGGAGSVWLDKLAGDRSETGMIEGVKDSDVFVAVISESYFKSKFCCLEVHTALKLGKPIVPVWNQSKKTVQDALGWIPPELKFLNLKELLPIQEDFQMASMCATRINEQVVKSFDLTSLTDDQRREVDEYLTSQKSSPLKTGKSCQNFVQAANFVQAGLEVRRGQLDPATASLEARLKRLEDALQRPLALGEFEGP